MHKLFTAKYYRKCCAAIVGDSTRKYYQRSLGRRKPSETGRYSLFTK